MEELWKPIKNYEGYYAVSNLGRIKSLKRTIQPVSKSGKVHNSYEIKEKFLKFRTESGEVIQFSGAEGLNYKIEEI